MIWSRVLLGRGRLAHHTLFGWGRTRTARPRRPLLGGALAVMLGAIVAIGLTSLFGQIASEAPMPARRAACSR